MKKLTDLQMLLLGMVLIMSCSAAMQKFIFSKRQKNQYRHQLTVQDPKQSDKFVVQGPPVEGKVVIIGVDRFYLNDAAGKRWVFSFGSAPHPQLGERLRVFYYQGSPPTALRLEPLPEPHKTGSAN